MTVSLHGTSVLHMSLFKFGFERRKCPSAWAETSFRRERPVKEEQGSKEDGDNSDKAPETKRRQVPKSRYNVLHLHEENLPLWLR